MSRIKDTQALKQLQSQKAKLQVLLDEKNHQKTEVSHEVNNLKQKMKNLDVQIEDLTQKSKDPVVTEHAILRYFEHVLDYDIEALKKAILAEGRAEAITAMGSGKLPIIDGHKLVIKDRVVVTIAHKDY